MKKMLPWLCLTFLTSLPALSQTIDASRPLSECDLQLAFSKKVDAACMGQKAGNTGDAGGEEEDPGLSRGLGIRNGPVQAPAGNAGGMVENKPRGVEFPSVTFASGSARLAAGAIPNLNKVGDFLAKNADVRMEIGGHTDAAGTDEANKALSQRRANAVMNVLVSRGASESQFLPIGYGEERLVPDQPCVSEKQRRVELYVVGTNPWTAPTGTPRFCN